MSIQILRLKVSTSLKRSSRLFCVLSFFVCVYLLCVLDWLWHLSRKKIGTKEIQKHLSHTILSNSRAEAFGTSLTLISSLASSKLKKDSKTSQSVDVVVNWHFGEASKIQLQMSRLGAVNYKWQTTDRLGIYPHKCCWFKSSKKSVTEFYSLHFESVVICFTLNPFWL